MTEINLDRLLFTIDANQPLSVEQLHILLNSDAPKVRFLGVPIPYLHFYRLNHVCCALQKLVENKCVAKIFRVGVPAHDRTPRQLYCLTAQGTTYLRQLRIKNMINSIVELKSDKITL